MKTVIQPEKKRRHIYLVQGIVYDEEPVKDGMRELNLSLLTPFGKTGAEEEQLPCVVWICGGAWMGGRERHAEMLPELMYLADNGYIIAAAEYRVRTEAVFPAQISDVLSAVRFLKCNAGKYHIDPERIAVMGSSAGGHLALLAANNDGQFDTEKYPDVSSRIRCAVDLYGISDLEQVFRYNLNALKEGKRIGRASQPEQFPESGLLGGLPSEMAESARRASGISGICEHTCPVLVMHGDCDHAVNIEQSELYYEAMTKAGKDIEYYAIHGADHGSDEFYQDEAKYIILEFLNKKL